MEREHIEEPDDILEMNEQERIRDERIMQMVLHLEGHSDARLASEQTYKRRLSEKRETMPWEEMAQMQAEARYMVQQRRTEWKRNRVRNGASTLKAKSKGRLTFSEPQIAAIEAYVATFVDPEALELYNAQLREAHSGNISLRDIAIVAITHHASVTGNKNNGMDNANTSPFARITKASVEVFKRHTKLDNRQVRYCLQILVELDFTEETEKGMHGNDDKTKNKAGKWSIKRDPEWTHLMSLSEIPHLSSADPTQVSKNKPLSTNPKSQVLKINNQQSTVGTTQRAVAGSAEKKEIIDF